ncbi:MAG: hypothetical protein ACJAT4_002090, partial [Granulosicoccus sp.]
MKKMGIDPVILIRCGHKKWMTYPAGFLEKTENVSRPHYISFISCFLWPRITMHLLP